MLAILAPSSMQQQIARVAAMHQQPMYSSHSSSAALAQPRMMRGATAPTLATQQQQQQQQQHGMHQPRPILRATVVAGESANATAASASGINLPMAAHVLADAADVELSKRLQSRLATLGIGMNMVKAEVRVNAATAAAAHSFTLTLTGRIQLALGSLFNILIAQFLKQHPQINQVERKIAFVPSAASAPSAASLSRARSGETSMLSREEDDAPSVDSPPILQLKIKHLAKLMAASANTVVYTGDYLCQAAAAASSASTASPAITDLSAPHPPALLTEWVRSGRIQHIINENMDGYFNVAAPARSAKQPRSIPAQSFGGMSDEEDSSCHSDDDNSSSSGSHSSSSSSRRSLPVEQLSEVFGNKFQEICSTNCGHPGMPGNASIFTRDFEVQMRQPPLRIRPAGSNQIQFGLQAGQDSHLTGRFCSYCSAPLRDTLIGWNESLPRVLMQRCVATATQAELSLVLGSRLRVSPVSDLPTLAPAGSSTLVIVQASATAKDEECLQAGGILIRCTPAVVLAKLDVELKRIRKEQVTAAAAAASAQQATPAIVRKATNASAASSAAASAAALSSSAVRVIALRPASSALALSLSHRDMKKKRSITSSSTAAALALFTQRRGAPANLGLARPGMLRASTAAPSLLSMGSCAAARSTLPLSAALPPFPCLDDDEEVEEEGDGADSEEEQHMHAAAPAPARARAAARGRAYSAEDTMHSSAASSSSMMPPRISSITSSAGSISAGGATNAAAAAAPSSNSASMLLMMAALRAQSAETMLAPSLHSPLPYTHHGRCSTLSPPPLPQTDELDGDDQRMN